MCFALLTFANQFEAFFVESGLRPCIAYGFTTFHFVTTASKADRIGGSDLIVSKMMTSEFALFITWRHIKGRASFVLLALQSASIEGLHTFVLWPKAFDAPFFATAEAFANQDKCRVCGILSRDHTKIGKWYT